MANFGEKYNNKILVILGPTATGKTKLAIKLANKFDGEIVSADSRQVYKGMDIGTGKDLDEYKITNYKLQACPEPSRRITNKFQNPKSKACPEPSRRIQTKSIPYHLIDIISPKTDFNVAKYQKLAYKAIDDILARGKLPIIVGGTGLYISAIVDGLSLPESTISSQELKKIRKKLDKLSLKQLLARLKKIDLKTYKIIDKKNRRRVQRAVEIYYETGKPKSCQPKGKAKYDCLQIGILPAKGSKSPAGLLEPLEGSLAPNDILHQRIEKRLDQRLRGGAMIKEVKRLHEKQKISWKRLESFGLEYKWVSYYLQNKINYQEMKQELARAIKQFAKRQMTWFKRDERVVWESQISKVVALIKKIKPNGVLSRLSS